MTCTCHAIANAISDQLNDEYKIDIDPTRLANILVNNNQHVGAVWPDDYDKYNRPILTMDEKSNKWISIKIKTVKRVGNFIKTEKHVLSYNTEEIRGTWANKHCVFVREQLGDSYHCVNSWGDSDVYPHIPVARPGNILWIVRAEWEYAPKC